MKLENIINEQNTVIDNQEQSYYSNLGYTRISSKLVDTYSKTGDIKTDKGGKKWFKQSGSKPSIQDAPPKPTQTVDPSVFNCIKNSRGWGSKLASKSDEPNAYSFLNDVQSEFVFFGDGKFYIQLNSGEKMFGTWKCKGQSSYEIEINNTDFNKKQYFRSETSQWADHQNAAALEENFIKKIVTKHLRSKL